MKPEYFIPIFTVLLSVGASILGSWLVFRAQTRRIGSQNVLDESSALEIQMRVNTHIRAISSKAKSKENEARKLEARAIERSCYQGCLWKCSEVS